MTAEDATVIWQPPADARRSTVVGRYLTWLEEECGRTFTTYDDLWRWSVDDLTGFWSSVWSFFDVQASVPYEAVLRHPQMPGAQWFRGLPPELRRAGTEDDR